VNKYFSVFSRLLPTKRYFLSGNLPAFFDLLIVLLKIIHPPNSQIQWAMSVDFPILCNFSSPIKPSGSTGQGGCFGCRFLIFGKF